MRLRVLHADEHGHKKIMKTTEDPNGVVLAISYVQNIPVSELWIALGVGKPYRYIAAHQIAEALGEDRPRSLLFFHAFTWRDVI